MGSGTGERSICMSYLKCTNGETLNKRLNLPVPQCNHTGNKYSHCISHSLAKAKALREFLKCFAKVRNNQHFLCSCCTPGTLTSYPREPHRDYEMGIHTLISDRCRDLSQHVADPGFTQTPPTPGTHICLMYRRKGHIRKQGPQRAHLQLVIAEGPANHPSLMNYSSPNPKPQ